MTAEILGLAIASLLLAFAWLPASLARARAGGVRWLTSNREPGQLPTVPEWGHRAQRAHDNLKENFPAWAALLLLVILIDATGQTSAIAALVFPAARLVHMGAYMAGNVWLRFLAWLAAWISTLVLAVVVLSAVL
jgi:uncharacterized MAPEG superfamily protein